MNDEIGNLQMEVSMSKSRTKSLDAEREKAVEHLQRAVAMLNKLCTPDMPAGSEHFAVAHDARTEIRGAIATLGANAFPND